MSLIKSITNHKDEFKIFIRFLKENGIFSAYFRELNRNNDPCSTFFFIYKKNKKDFFSKCHPSDWTDYCFCWANTRAGDYFWSNVNNLWKSYLKNEI